MAKGDNLIKHQWNPGHAPYAEWLKKLTPEQRAAHLQKRREKKAMKQAMKEVVEEYQHRWVAEMNMAAWKVLQRARETGDPQAFIAVYDRIIGRPQEAQQDDNRPLPWSDADI